MSYIVIYKFSNTIFLHNILFAICIHLGNYLKLAKFFSIRILIDNKVVSFRRILVGNYIYLFDMPLLKSIIISKPFLLFLNTNLPIIFYIALYELKTTLTCIV